MKNLYLAVLFLIFHSIVIQAQTNLRGWHGFGQTWLVWEDTDPTPETYRIYKSSSSISELSSAEQIGRIFEFEWMGGRLNQLEEGLTYTVPDGSGGTYTLANNEALFVYTSLNTASEYFAVVKDGETTVGPNNRVGPINQTMDSVQCHLQTSGILDGFEYRVFAHWIAGQDDWNSGRIDYPVMGNEHFNGTAHFFRIWYPQAGQPSSLTPTVIALHGGGGWYGGRRPGTDNKYDLPLSDAIVICPGDRIIIRKTNGLAYQKTYWFGYWEGYDRFRVPDEQPLPNDGLVINYTMKRIDWELGWLLENENIDPKRVSLLGGSMGGRGANYLARTYPERFAAWLSLSPGIEPASSDPFVGNAPQNLPTNLPGSPGVLDVMDLHTVLSGTERDIPFGKIVIGRADVSGPSGWTTELMQVFEDMNNTGFGCHLYWDDRGHVYSSGSYWADSFRLKAKALTLYSNDQSFPAFYNDDQDTNTPGRQPDIGDGDPANGDTWGTWGGYYSWDPETMIDTPDLWEATVFLMSESENPNDNPSFDSSQADVSIRRPQQFKPVAGSTIYWILKRSTDSQVLQSGQEIIGPDSVVTIPNLTVYKEECKLTVSTFETSINNVPENPTEFALSQNYPNPFNPITEIVYQLPKPDRVLLQVYNNTGQLIGTLVNDQKTAGRHSVIWDASEISSGVYFYKIVTKHFVNVKKCLILK